MEEPILYIKMQIAVFKLEKGDQKECKKLLEDGKSTLDSMTDIDPSVYASYYWVSSQYHKSRQEFSEFYKSALLYLAYTSVESLSETFKLVCPYLAVLEKRLKSAFSNSNSSPVVLVVDKFSGYIPRLPPSFLVISLDSWFIMIHNHLIARQSFF